MWKIICFIFLSYIVESVISTLLTMKGTEFITYDVTGGNKIVTEDLRISFKFKTIDPSALLLFSDSGEDYISLELIDGKLR